MDDLLAFLDNYQVMPGFKASKLSKVSTDGEIFLECALSETALTNLKQALAVRNLSHNVNYKIVPRAIANNLKRHPKIKNVIAVGSGKGGVGKSSVALNLAKSLLSSGVAVGLLDLDLYGPNIPRMLGFNSPEVSAAQHDLLPLNANGLAVISLAQVVANQDPILWRGPMAGKVVDQLFWQADWPDLDYLIIDLPPGTGDILITVMQKLPVTGVVLVTTPQSIACMDAEKAVGMFRQQNINLLGFVNNMSYFICNSCDHKHEIFMGSGINSMIDSLQLDCLLELPLASEIALANERGADLPETITESFGEFAMKVANKINAGKKDRSLMMPGVSVINKER